MDEYEKKLELIRYYNASRNYDRLRLACLDALKDNPRDSWLLIKLSYAYYELDMFDECADVCRDIIACGVSPYVLYAYDMMSSIYADLNDPVKSEEYAKKAVDGDPNDADLLVQYAWRIANNGRLDEALEVLARAEAINPKSSIVLFYKNQIYHYYLRDREAEFEILARLTAVSNDPYRLNLALGNFYYKYKEFAEAHSHYTKAVAVKPTQTRDCEEAKAALRELEAYGYGVSTENCPCPNRNCKYCGKCKECARDHHGKNMYCRLSPWRRKINDILARFC
ncbi:MAG: hypothetical protein LBK57_01215 [Clostridiales Family XIII bacterium]|nr:hypothetical protein [Clostridiales Family XIII bacterium]